MTAGTELSFPIDVQKEELMGTWRAGTDAQEFI